MDQGFHIVSFEMRGMRIPLFTSATFDLGAKASILIGPNGSGKSRVLAALADEMTNIHRVRRARIAPDDDEKTPTRPRLLDLDRALAPVGDLFSEEASMEKPEARVLYQLDGDRWEVSRDGEHLQVRRNGQFASVEDMVFPDRVLAIAHLPIDKFRFARGVQTRSEEFYRYRGLRQATNMTTTGALGTKALMSFLAMAGQPASEEFLKEWLPKLGLDPDVSVSLRLPSFLQTALTQPAELRRLLSDPDLPIRQVRTIPKPETSTTLDEEELQALQELSETIVRLNQTRVTPRKTATIDLYPQHDDGRAASTVLRGLSAMRRFRPGVAAELEFHRNGEAVSFSDLSSGEQQILTTLSELVSNIGGTALVLIDEPEVSLHPRWQRDYVPALLETLKSHPSTHAVIATHSHFMVANLPTGRGSLTVAGRTGSAPYEVYDGEVYGRSPDNVLYRVFGLGTAGNRFVEIELRRALRMVSGQDEFDREALRGIYERLMPLAADDNPALGEILSSILARLDQSADPD